jgi:hypothetical protein
MQRRLPTSGGWLALAAPSGEVRKLFGQTSEWSGWPGNCFSVFGIVTGTCRNRAPESKCIVAPEGSEMT